jgi:GntR family transcriptional regulator/MocR family aminotransferase
VPRWARHALTLAKQCADWHSPVLEQDALAAFITEGHMARHVRKMRKLYSDRRSQLACGLDTHFSPWLEPIAASGGMHLTALARRPLDWDAIAGRAREIGLDVRSLQVYCVGNAPRSGLVLGYGGTPPAAIRAGLAQLRQLFPREPLRAPAASRLPSLSR